MKFNWGKLFATLVPAFFTAYFTAITGQRSQIESVASGAVAVIWAFVGFVQKPHTENDN